MDKDAVKIVARQKAMEHWQFLERRYSEQFMDGFEHGFKHGVQWKEKIDETKRDTKG